MLFGAAAEGRGGATELEHIPDDEGALREIARVLQPGARLVMSCDSLSNPGHQRLAARAPSGALRGEALLLARIAGMPAGPAH